MLPAVAVAAIFFSIAVYIAVSILDSRKIISASGFYHNAGSPIKAVISLTAYNVTLGTGFAYILTQAGTTGWLIFLTPLAIFLGYVAIAFYYKAVAYTANQREPNIFFLLIPDGRRSSVIHAFPRTFSIFMALTFLLVLAYELNVGSSIIINAIFYSPTTPFHIGFAILVFFVVSIYTALAGLRAAVDTDIWQFGFIILFIIVLMTIVQPDSEGTLPPNVVSPEDTPLSMFAAILAIITAITTQFYSIVNSNMGSNFPKEKQFWIFISVGVLSGLIYTAVAWIGLHLHSTHSLEETIRGALVYSNNTSIIAYVEVFFIFAGMLAILLSTLDNMTICVSQIIYENLFRGNAFSSDKPEEMHLHLLKRGHFAVSVVVIIVMMLMASYFKDVFTLLLTILFAATIMSPIACTAIFIHSRGRVSMMSRASVAWSIFGVTLICWLVYMYITAQGEKLKLDGIMFHLGCFILACTVAVVDYFTAVSSGGSVRRAVGAVSTTAQEAS